MSLAGDLDLEKLGINGKASTAYGYTSGNLTTITTTVTDSLLGNSVYVKTFTYNGDGTMATESGWIKQ